MAKRKAAAHKRLKRTVQESIPYENVYKNGVIETESGVFSKTYELADINFKIAPDEEQTSLFLAYGRVINSFDIDSSFQITIQNSRADKSSTLDEVRLAPKRDGLNKYRQDINRIILDKLSGGRSNIKQKKYLTISLEDESVDAVMKRFSNMDQQASKIFRAMAKDYSVTPLTLEERLFNLFTIYNQDGEGVFYNALTEDGVPFFDAQQLGYQGLTTKDILGPSGMSFKPNYFTLGNTYGRIFYLANTGNYLSTDFISDLSELPTNLIISVKYTPIDSVHAMKLVKDKLTSLNSQIAAKQKQAVNDMVSFDLIPEELAMQQSNIRELLNDVTSRDQKLFYVSFSMALFADTMEELTSYTKQVNAISNRHMAPLKTLLYQQEIGLNCTLPLCRSGFPMERLLTTESSSIFIPYTTQEMHMKGGVPYGINEESKSLIIYNRILNENYNELVFGKPGTGKSLITKWEHILTFLKNDNTVLYIIDPMGEYSESKKDGTPSLAEALGGEVVNLAPGSKSFLNPLDMDLDYGEESDPLSIKTEYIISMIEIMLGKDRIIDPEGKSIISRCVQSVYSGYLQHLDDLNRSGIKTSFDKDSSPTLSNLYHELLAQPEPAAGTLARVLEMYAEGALATFSHRSNVDSKKRVLVYNTKHLGTGTKELGIHICLNDVWNKMIDNAKQGIWTYFIIDEFHVLLQSDAATKFLLSIWKMARKWLGCPTGIMQNTEDLLRSEDGREILANTSLVTMMSLSKMDRANLEELLQIPESLMKYIHNNDPGHGLLYTGKTMVPFANEIPETSLVYKIMSTSAEKDRLIRDQMKYRG